MMQIFASEEGLHFFVTTCDAVIEC